MAKTFRRNKPATPAQVKTWNQQTKKTARNIEKRANRAKGFTRILKACNEALQQNKTAYSY